MDRLENSESWIKVLTFEKSISIKIVRVEAEVVINKHFTAAYVFFLFYSPLIITPGGLTQSGCLVILAYLTANANDPQ